MNNLMLPVIPNSPLRSSESSKLASFRLIEDRDTGLVRNADFSADVLAYDENYQNDQSLSDVFLRHMGEVYGILKTAFPKGGRLVEVGCGKGAFLRLVAEDCHFEYSGYDAAYEGNDKHIYRRYLTINDRIECDIVVLRHTLEHIEAPHEFLKLLKTVFGDDAFIFIEVPQFSWIETNKVLFDLTYEHVNYFNQRSLHSLFEKVELADDFFGGQYQYCMAKFKYLNTLRWRDAFKSPMEAAYPLAGFVDAFRRRVDELPTAAGIWVWGGATKGVLFLTHLEQLSNEFGRIRGVIDLNPSKQGLFTAGTKTPILHPHSLVENAKDDDFVLVMNPNYLVEVADYVGRYVSRKLKVMAF